MTPSLEVGEDQTRQHVSIIGNLSLSLQHLYYLYDAAQVGRDRFGGTIGVSTRLIFRSETAL